MTFRLRHEWVHGARLPTGVRLASCIGGCETLRVELDNEIPHRLDRVHFIQRAIDPSSPEDRRTNLILEEEPPCIAAVGFFRPPEDRSVKASDAIQLPREPAHGVSPASTPPPAPDAQTRLPW